MAGDGGQSLSWRLLGRLAASGTLLLLSAFDGYRSVLLREAIDATLGVDQLLTPCEKRVALRTNFENQVGLG